MTSPEQILCMTNRDFKWCLSLSPGHLVPLQNAFCHTSEIQARVDGRVLTEGHRMMLTTASLPSPPVGWSCLHLPLVCTTPVQGQSRKERWWGKSKQPFKFINKSCLNQKWKLWFHLKQGWKRGWTPPLLWCCSENLDGPHINRTEWKGCRNQMLWYFWMQSWIRPQCLAAPVQSSFLREQNTHQAHVYWLSTNSCAVHKTRAFLKLVWLLWFSLFKASYQSSHWITFLLQNQRACK